MTHRLSSTSTGRSESSSNFRSKPPEIQALINEALDILDAFGIPMTDTARRRECMAMAFLAVAGVSSSSDWGQAKDFEQDRAPTSRDIIEYRNAHFGESGSSGSYDDVRRKDLKPLLASSIIVNSLPGSAHNSPSRGYSIHPEFAKVVRTFGTSEWQVSLANVLDNYETLREQLSADRQMQRIPITLAPGVDLEFGPGAHNELQKAVVEEFFPRYGYGAEILYLGDAEDKDAHLDKDRLHELGFFSLDHKQLPDVVGYSADKQWIYVVEAVTSFGPLNAYRHVELRKLLAEVNAEGVIYVTAFPSRDKVFRQYVPEISWETEVWIASEPDHLIHFDGKRFLGPYGD
ncbi:MAG: hypothetical protein J0H66_07265 [Solirubrobacterales bacterium]|nr:hypothetical protein [Solirubrobacterales bacterium]